MWTGTTQAQARVPFSCACACVVRVTSLKGKRLVAKKEFSSVALAIPCYDFRPSLWRGHRSTAVVTYLQDLFFKRSVASLEKKKKEKTARSPMRIAWVPDLQFPTSPAASPESLYHTVWRTWLSIAYSDKRLLYYQFSLLHLYISLLEGWENVLRCGTLPSSASCCTRKLADTVLPAPLSPLIRQHCKQTRIQSNITPPPRKNTVKRNPSIRLPSPSLQGFTFSPSPSPQSLILSQEFFF